ncbi:hypothetical protein CDO52_13075 [Nocardiopsis gilva YIM 90087]|uniref:Uncharacterized protein n=1 Tax=Nocardiopsis gilva YIM 90087 TaxID=1235441 RepID=A0A223S666_9ACTN|nr:hypothetical protein [Nocardiopsis gilva]ASU83601.1 hypothetical protein CDO52_13075 [Nocardiopsis gilva YIM 90087]
MTIRQERRHTLHTWPGETDDETALRHLRARYDDHLIWRATREDMTPGDWCAQRVADGKAFTASSPEELRELLEEAR